MDLGDPPAFSKDNKCTSGEQRRQVQSSCCHHVQTSAACSSPTAARKTDLMTVCLLQLAESRTEESCLEEKSTWKTLPEECISTEDIGFAIRNEDIDVTTSKKKPTSCCNSLPRHYSGLFSAKDEFGMAEKTHMAEMSPEDRAISLPENVILELLQAPQVAAGSLSEGNTLEEKSNDIDGDKFIVVIFTNQCTSSISQELEMTHGCVYLGSFSRSTLSDEELIFVPHTEVQSSVLLELFRCLPNAFPPYVITEFGESKVLCLKKPDLICHFKEHKGHSLDVRPEQSSSSFNVENINVFKAPGTYLTHCLELTSVPSSVEQSVSESILTNTDKEVMSSSNLPENNLSDCLVFAAHSVADSAITTRLSPSSDGNCFPQMSYFVPVGQKPSLLTGNSTSEVSLWECANALSTPVGLEEYAGAIPDENVDGQLSCEHIGETLLPEPGQKSHLSLQPPGKAERDFHASLGEEERGQSAGIQDDDACSSHSSAPVRKNLEQVSIEGTPVPVDSGWSREAKEESWCSAEAGSSGDSKEDFALGILSELRSLSHSLLDVFDIIQRTPPLTKKGLSLPREVLSQHKVLHASTSSLESCPLAQSECFCGDEVGASKSTKKRRKRKKKCSM